VNYPNYPPPGQQYPPQQPQYPPPGQPQYPPPAQNYPPPGNGYYPPPQNYAPPQQELPKGTIDGFYDQPAASGKSIASWFQTPGQSLSGFVARALTDADTRPQTDMATKQPKRYSDGRLMYTLTIPLTVQPSADFPDGRAAWIISSGDREDLDVAMQAAGCPPRTVPEAGALITITFMGLKQIPGFGAPKKVKRITYQRPPGAAPAPPPAPAAVAPPPPAPPGPQQYQGYNGNPAVPQYADPAGQAAQDMVNGNGAALPPPWDPAAAYQQATGQPPPPPQPPQPPAQQQFAAPDGLTPEQAERLRQLTGGQ